MFTVSNVKNKKIKAALTWISDSRVMVNFPPGADLATLTISIGDQNSNDIDVRYSRPHVKEVHATLSGALTVIGDNFGDSTRLSIDVIDLDATTDNTRSCADLERESYETLRCKLGESGSP